MNTLALVSQVKSLFDTLHLSSLFGLSRKTAFLDHPTKDIKTKLYEEALKKKSYIAKEYRKFLYGNIFSEYAREILSHDLVDVFSWL
jgi:hypothetical protein